MGSAFGRLLLKDGLRVVTTCEDRSPGTEEQARAAGIEILLSLDDVVSQSQIVFSIVLPSAAVEVAQQYANRQQMRPRNSVFVDANSIGVNTIEQIERSMDRQKIPLVDATIQGGAQQLENIGLLNISGPSAKSVEELCRRILRVNRLGERIGSASCMKLLIAGMNKTLVAMFLEIGTMAERVGMLEAFLENCRQFYPGIMTVIDRTLPTYPRHAARRVVELRNLEECGQAYQMSLDVIHEAGNLIERVSAIDWNEMDLGSPADIHTIVRCLEKVYDVDN